MFQTESTSVQQTLQMHFSKERPLTSRTRKRLEQLEDDEELAKVIAMEEDEKIAQK